MPRITRAALWIGMAVCIPTYTLAAGMISQAMLVGWAQHGVPWSSAPALVLLAAAAFLAEE